MAQDDKGFTPEERAAMKQRAEELRTTKGLKGAARLARELEACVAAIEELHGVDGELARTVHRIVSEEAPELAPKTWYGFPTYAKEGSVIVFVQPSTKFDTRYPTLNFAEDADLDDGDIWPVSFAVVAVTPSVENRIRALVQKAVS